MTAGFGLTCVEEVVGGVGHEPWNKPPKLKKSVAMLVVIV